MRLRELFSEDSTAQDPFLSNDQLVMMASYWMGSNFVDWVRQVSPYSESSPYKSFKGIYTKIINSITPVARSGNIDQVIAQLNKEIPVVGVPSWVTKKIQHRKQEIASIKPQPYQATSPESNPGDEFDFASNDTAYVDQDGHLSYNKTN